MLAHTPLIDQRAEGYHNMEIASLSFCCCSFSREPLSDYDMTSSSRRQREGPPFLLLFLPDIDSREGERVFFKEAGLPRREFWRIAEKKDKHTLCKKTFFHLTTC